MIPPIVQIYPIKFRIVAEDVRSGQTVSGGCCASKHTSCALMGHASCSRRCNCRPSAGKEKRVQRRLVLGSLSAVSEAPTSEELGVETLWRGASDTAT